MAKKFFKAKEEKKPASPCEQCKLHSVCISPKLRPEGRGRLGIAIILDKPYSSMDKAETLAAGPEYTFLKNTLNKIGIDLEEDCYLIPVLSCRTPKDRLPTAKEVKFCKERFTRVMERLNPNVIIPMGKWAFDAVVGSRIKGRLTGTGWDEFINCVIPDQELKQFIAPNYSIETMLETKTYADSGYTSKPLYMRDKAWYNLWKDNFYKACSHWDKKVDVIDYTSMCHITEDIDQAIDWITEAMEWEYCAYDIETVSIKPYREGTRILSVSISNGEVSYAFPFFEDFTFKRVFKRLMLSSVKKISHNTSFEYQWIKQKEGYYVENSDIDTMLMAHCIHNQKPTGLKYETYTRLGVISYDEKADEYISSTTEEKEKYGDNAFNRLAGCPIQDMLLYNAMDSLFTYKIFEQMRQELDEFQWEGYKFLNESSLWLTQAQVHGFRVDVERYNEVTLLLENKIKELEAEVLQCAEIDLWDKEEPFNYNSGSQLGYLLYEKMGIKPLIFTEGGKPATNIEALENVKVPLVEKILQIRKYQKLFGTYIHQFALEQTDGRIHAFTYLNRVDTFRSSMGSINIQNQPKRDKFAKSLITSMVLPEKGQKLASYDLKAIEIAINACYSKDKQLNLYVNDFSQDMHKMSTMKVFMLEPNEVKKTTRQGIKSGFQFSSFYGSYYKQTAPDLWELAKEEGLIEHLASKGIKTYVDFERHVERCEKWLWQEQFPQHDAWRKKQWGDYQKDGVLLAKTGFKFQAPMRRNNTFNSPVQCVGYHVNQYTFNKVSAFIIEKNLKSRILFQIHDSISVSVEPGEDDLIDWAMWYFGTQEIKEHWSWLDVNIVYEKEAGLLNENWGTLKEVGMLGEGGKIAQK